MKLSTLTFIFIFLFALNSHAQVSITGTVVDKEGNAMPECNVRLLDKDKKLIRGAVADFEGQFTITASPDSNYILLFSYIGYESFYQNIQTSRSDLNLGKIRLKEDAKYLQEVEVKTTQSRGVQKSDTADFNAAAFKTHPDATAEDLVKKMPGITSDNSGIKVNGETVQKVLVDGKAFFGDDASAALKNLPADLIERVQVFDKMSDQAAFTGFNDGEQQKTINLVTKKEKIVGNFGRVYAGAGADEDLQGRYNAGAAINSFNDKRRVTFLLLGNNVNQQNFTTADLSGAMSSSSQRGGGQGGGRQGGSGNSSFLSPNQNGITSTRSAGLNYSDEWGKKVQVSGSYFFNNTDNVSRSSIVRNYFTENKLVYQQQNQDRMSNNNHRLNFRFEYTIDSSNKLVITPAITFQNNDARSILSGKNLVNDGTELSNTGTSSRSLNKASDISNMVLFQHKMNKAGRTVSLRLNTSLNDRDNEGSYYSSNRYSDTTESVLDQDYETNSFTRKLSGNLAYTEPLSKFSQLQLSYSPSYSESGSDKQTMDLDPATGMYSDFNPSLSNKYNNVYQTQKGGLMYRYRKESLQLSFGADAQQSNLNGVQEFPNAFTLNQTFSNILPSAMLNYKISKSNNLRIWYRSSTDIPSVTQLQNVVDISNPLQVKMGNPSLKQTFDNNLNIRLGGFNAKSARNVMLFMNGTYSDNYISNATYVLQSE
jgi:hypothetical protein